MSVEVTRFTKSGGALTKRLHLHDGVLGNDSSQCRMSAGVAERVRLDDWRDFARIIEETPNNAAWSLGCMRRDADDTAQLVLEKDQPNTPGSVARTTDFFAYRRGEPAFALLDFDAKGMPAETEARIAEFGGFLAALTTVCPDIAGAAYIRRASTSSGVSNADTGETYPSSGEHVYLVVPDGSDVKRFLYALHERAWLNGLGWHMVGRGGQLLERSIIDRAVFGAERLVFEAPPDLEPPLAQLPRKAAVHDGPPLDTRAACRDLSTNEQRELARLKAASAAILKPACATARADFIDEMVADAVSRGEDPDAARETAESLSNRTLRPSAVLDFADRDIGQKSVGDVLTNPDRFVGKSLADPIEGVEYGQQTAKVLRRPSGEIFVHSFAHGGISYRFVPEDGERIDDGSAALLGDFVAYMQSSDCIFMPSSEFWPAARVNARLAPVPLVDKNGAPVVDKKTGEQKKIPASAWLAEHAPVEQMTWAPGLPQLIRHKLITNGGWFDHKNATVLNLYRPPPPTVGDATRAGAWLDHVRRVYPDDADQMILRFAHCVQRPDVKINHGLVLGGVPGIGKDTILEPVKRAVGTWNFVEVSPPQMLGRFNGFVKSVVLRISEARDLGEIDRFKFYDHMKVYLASPPDVIRVDEKNLREHSVLNVCFVVMTTNYKTDGIYLPADDRRYYVTWSECRREDFDETYWDALYGWYNDGGFGHVAAYLTGLDLSGFDPKAPPPKTDAFWAIVDANRAPEDAELADVIDTLSADGPPIPAFTLEDLLDRAIEKAPKDINGNVARGCFADWLGDRKNRRQVPHRLEQCGYAPVRTASTKDGLWVINGKRQVIYARNAMPTRDRLAAAAALVSYAEPPRGRTYNDRRSSTPDF